MINPKQVETWWEVPGRECILYIEQRPPYCDRGRYLVKVSPHYGTDLMLEFDRQDGFPRYYFFWDTMLREIEAWMEKRGQLLSHPMGEGHTT